MHEVLIVGVGDRQRGDDGIGPVIVEQLRRRIQDERVHLLATPRLREDLAELVSQCDLVVFVTTRLDGMTGQISSAHLEPSPQRSKYGDEMGPAELLAVARFVHGRAPQALLLSVSGEALRFGQRMSGPVQMASLQLVGKLSEMVANALRGAPLVMARDEMQTAAAAAEANPWATLEKPQGFFTRLFRKGA